MTPTPRFHLGHALAAWRRSLEHSRAFTADDLDELEQHLRDQVAGLAAEGLDEKTAFRRALQEMGEYTRAESEYRKVYWGKMRRRHQILPEIAWRYSMFKNYLKIGLRSMVRRKGFSFIHVLGLSIGLAACMLIGLYIHDELSYDAFHANAERTYRVLRQFDLPDLHTTIETTPTALAAAIEEQLPSVERAVRVGMSSPVVKQGEREFIESRFLEAEAGFFDIFSFPMLQGEASMDRPGTLVLKESMAAKYFPGENPIGRTLEVGNRDYEVTGIMAGIPSQSHLQFDFVASLQIKPDQLNWGMNNHFTYVLLGEGASKEEVTGQIASVIAGSRPDREGQSDDFIPHLQPVMGIHLGRGMPVDIGSQSRMLYIYLFGALAVFILLLACINFMNLATARSLDRAHEVGMRKTLGARRPQLGGQFLGESILTSVVALALALGLCFLMLPVLNEFAGKELEFGALFRGSRMFVVLGLVLCTGLLAGSYPALVLSHFKPINTLKGAISGVFGERLRKGLVVFQFALSIALIAGTGVVLDQLRYMQSAGLGFEAENLLVVDQAGYLGGRVRVFEEEAVQVAGVEHAASSFSMPGTFFINSMWEPAEPGAEAHNLDYSFVNFDYIETLGIEMAAGRGISRAYATDSSAVMLNETAARDFGWSPEEAVQKKIRRGDYEYTIVGVMKDFHYRSLRAEIYSLALFAPWRGPRYVAVRFAPERVVATLESLEAVWRQLSDLPFSYFFLDDSLAEQYRAEQRMARIFIVFSGLAILIACLGLFGLAAYTAEKRTREIGIRKVLGATTGSLLSLLSRDFMKLVVVAFVLAVPIGYLATNRWLQEYAYHVGIGVEEFALAGGLALLVALGTVSYQSIKAALADPVKSLRHE